jgi:hypothetical protein
LSRPIYAAIRFKIVSNKKVLFTIGVFLFSFPFLNIEERIKNFKSIELVNNLFTANSHKKYEIVHLNAWINPRWEPNLAWFEWGTTMNLENSTQPELFLGDSVEFNYELNDIKEDTIYYYRMVRENRYEIIKTLIYSFFVHNDELHSEIVFEDFTPEGYFMNCEKIKIRGTIQPGVDSTFIWYEWGITPELKNSTPRKVLTTDLSYEYEINNLIANNSYYIRRIVETNGFRQYGDIMKFTTCLQDINSSQDVIIENL